MESKGKIAASFYMYAGTAEITHEDNYMVVDNVRDRNFHDGTLHDRILLYCEFTNPCINTETIMQDQQFEKHDIKCGKFF